MNMQRIFKFSRLAAVGDSSPSLFQVISQRTLSTTTCRHHVLQKNPEKSDEIRKKNPARYLQDLDVGQQALRLCTVHTLLDEHPTLSAEQVNDIANGMVIYDEFLLKIKDSPLLSPLLVEQQKDILSKIGELQRNEGDDDGSGMLGDLLDEIKRTCIRPLSPSDMNTLIKSQHSRFFLRRFCAAADIEVAVSHDGVEDGEHIVSCVFDEQTVVATARDTVRYDAISKVCLAALKSQFTEQFDAIDMNDFPAFPLEKEFDVFDKREMSHQCFINVTKSPDEELGITIRGGQQKQIKNKAYLQVSVITPIFISDVKADSPADKAGLRLGDVLLGVNEHSFKNKTHEQVLVVMMDVVNNTQGGELVELSFSVLYDRKVMMKYQLERKLLARELKYVKEEMAANDAVSTWHEARSKKDPMEYFMEQFVEPQIHRHSWQRGGKFQRLWHQYKAVRREPLGRIDTRKYDLFGDSKKKKE